MLNIQGFPPTVHSIPVPPSKITSTRVNSFYIRLSSKTCADRYPIKGTSKMCDIPRNNLVVAFAKSYAVSFFYGVLGHRRGMKMKTDMEAPGFRDIRADSTRLNAAWVGHNNPNF